MCSKPLALSEKIVEAVRKQIFPLQAQEAKELYRVGSSVGGVMSRQPGETTWRPRGLSKWVISRLTRTLNGVTLLITLLITDLLSPLGLQA